MYNYYIILDMFFIKLSRNSDFLTNIESEVSWIFSIVIMSGQSKKSINSNLDQQ